MMTNFFIVFDPMIWNFLSLNWLSSLLFLLLFSYNFWMVPSRFSVIFMVTFEFLVSELKLLINKKFYNNLLIYLSIFLFILINNFLSLFPYIFSSSSHLVYSLSLSLPLWLSLMFYGWINHLNEMFTHLVPLGTPYILMPFMVIIETISNFIRPWTLSVRLAANLIAGHLLLTLLGDMEVSSMLILLIMLILFIQNLLMLLEISVSLIQSYVFMTLSFLYSTEVFHYDKF